MVKDTLITRYLEDQEVYAIIWHDILVYIGIVAKYLFFLLCLYILVHILQNYIINHAWVMRWASIMWILIYTKGMYDVADEYFDSLVVTNRGLILLRWNGLFDYKTESLQWVSIESLSDEQNTFRDTLFKKWDISIKLEDERIRFKEVKEPSQKVALLLKRKSKILWRYEYHENETGTEAKDKYELLVEALGEVVTDYVDKKKQHDY